MGVRLRATVDYKDWDDLRGRILRIKNVRDRNAHEAAKVLHRLSKPYAPKDTGAMVDNSRVRHRGIGVYEIVYSKTKRASAGYIFDIALWLHNPEEFTRGGYKPSTPGTGPHWLDKAVDEFDNTYFAKLSDNIFQELVRRGVR